MKNKVLKKKKRLVESEYSIQNITGLTQVIKCCVRRLLKAMEGMHDILCCKKSDGLESPSNVRRNLAC